MLRQKPAKAAEWLQPSSVRQQLARLSHTACFERTLRGCKCCTKDVEVFLVPISNDATATAFLTLHAQVTRHHGESATLQPHILPVLFLVEQMLKR